MLFTADRLESLEIDPATLSENIKKYHELEERQANVNRQIKQARNAAWDLSRRMREQNYEGDEETRDPLSCARDKIQELEWVAERYEKELEMFLTRFTKEDKELYDRVEEYACESARDEAADRRTRWYESGCPE